MLSKNLLMKGELIGTHVKVPAMNIEGRIIDETKNTFVIDTNKKRKKVIKQNNIFVFMLNEKEVSIDGKKLAVRPEDRIAKCVISE